jgi:hypothetical protein
MLNSFVAAFEHVSLLSTKDHCRMTVRGFSIVTFDNRYRIVHMRIVRLHFKLLRASLVRTCFRVCAFVTCVACACARIRKMEEQKYQLRRAAQVLDAYQVVSDFRACQLDDDATVPTSSARELL